MIGRLRASLEVESELMMRMRIVAIAACVALMSSAVLADAFKDARAGEATFEVSKKTKPSVTFTSKAPGETFKGAGKEMKGSLTLDPSKLDAATGEFAVPFKSIDTGIGGRNKHMLSARWIDAGQYPDAVFVVEGIEKVKTGSSGVKASLKGTMKIHGQEKEMSVPVTLVYVKDKKEGGTKDTLAIKANFPVKLSDYGISDPAIGKKVAESMKLAVTVTLEAKPAKKSDEEKPAAKADEKKAGDDAASD